MHLLNVHTLTLETFIGGTVVPNYAILSHTWGSEEATFQDYSRPIPTPKSLNIRKPQWRCKSSRVNNSSRRRLRGPGHAKIYACCRQAKEDGFDFVWIDTCCIDKTSSVELSEAINSMFRYYGDASICYVFLADVRSVCHGRSIKDTALGRLGPANSNCVAASLRIPQYENVLSRGELLPSRLADFRKARWLGGGWTLQELIAPAFLKLFDESWTFIGWSGREVGCAMDCKRRMACLTEMLADLTGIPTEILLGRPLKRVSVGNRMSWASRRKTTRSEDMAYCLLGIFGVSMPLLYGEGSNAFERLQQEIIKKYNDHSVFAFESPAPTWVNSLNIQFQSGLGVSEPSLYMHARGMEVDDKDMGPSSHYTTTNTGVHSSLPLIELPSGETLVALNCKTSKSPAKRVCIVLVQSGPRSNLFYRRSQNSLSFLSSDYFKILAESKARRQRIYLAPPPNRVICFRDVHFPTLEIDQDCFKYFSIKTTYPNLWPVSRYKYCADEFTYRLLRRPQTTPTIYVQCAGKKEGDSDFILRIRQEMRKTGCSISMGDLAMTHQKEELSIAEIMLVSEQGMSNVRSVTPKWEKDIRFDGRRLLLSVELANRQATLRMEIPEGGSQST